MQWPHSWAAQIRSSPTGLSANDIAPVVLMEIISTFSGLDWRSCHAHGSIRQHIQHFLQPPLRAVEQPLFEPLDGPPGGLAGCQEPVVVSSGGIARPHLHVARTDAAPEAPRR